MTQHNKFLKRQHELGFWQVDPLPSEQDLADFYADLYYQKNKGNYSAVYTPDDLKFFKRDADVAALIGDTFYTGGSTTRKLLDIGCGEGFFAAPFFEKKWQVSLLDYSNYGLKKHNPQLLNYFKQGGIDVLLDTLAHEKHYWDLINLSHVLEHVIDPIALLKHIQYIMQSQTLLRIVVPNDYSPLQQLLLQEKMLTSETWFVPPEHISYFNIDSFKRVMAAHDFKIVKLLGSFPLDMYLLNEHSNYWKDRSKGKEAHQARMLLETLLAERDIKSYINLMEAFASCSLGRSIVAYVTL